MEDEDWFNPPWADAGDEVETNRAPRRAAISTNDTSLALETVSRLIRAESAFSRLDAILEEVPPLVREGIIARITLNEASGYLAHHKARISPRDLALRAAGITGSYTAALEAGRLGGELIWSTGDIDPMEMPDDWDIGSALALTRHLKILATRKNLNVLGDIGRLVAILSDLGVKTSDVERLEDWLGALPSQYSQPGLLLPAWILAHGLPGRQREDKLDIGAAFLAAAKAKEVGARSSAPFLIWAAPTSRLDRLGSQGGEVFINGYLECVLEAMNAGIREARIVQGAAEKIPELDRRAGSSLIAGARVAIHEPVITVGVMAAKLRMTPRAASTVLLKLVEKGFLTEITRREAWRAYSIK